MRFKRPRTTKLITTAELNGFSCAMAIVVFAVLACCMTTLGYHQAAISIELPKVSHSVAVGGLTWGPNRPNAMIVAVTKDGSIFMNNDRMLRPALTAWIERNIGDGSERTLYIRADAHAPYRSVKAVLEVTRSVGVEDVSFLTYR